MFIKTKLQVPQLKSGMLDRPHLIDRFSAARDSRLILISGPAGSGKTSLACQWIRHGSLPAAWYSLDKDDNEFDVFFRYLLNSLTVADHGLVEQIGPLLQGQKKLSRTEFIPPLIQALLALKKDVFLFLDDYHLITANDIHDGLDRLLQYLPPRLHEVLISRQSFGESISRSRIRHPTLEISPSDLKFAKNEIDAYFKKVIPLDLSRDQLQDLAQNTEGWAAALQLIGLSLKYKDSVDDLTAILNRARYQATDYLMHEVINAQPELVRRFLFKTALLDKFNADLCKEITGMEENAGILDHLYRINLFLIPLDPERKWYRYHHMFSEAIR